MNDLPIEYLIRLLDDPDDRVYQSVSQKIREIGPSMIPDLERALQGATHKLLHERFEDLIQILRFEGLLSDLKKWTGTPRQDLLTGITIMTRCQFPEMASETLASLLKPVKNEIWLELNDQLTALERIRVINSLLFRNGRYKIDDQHPESPGNNFVNRMLETGKGNEFSMALLYGWLCQELGLPVYVIGMPDYPILAYLDIPVMPENAVNPAVFDVLFFINPSNDGSVHSQKDIMDYLMRKSVPLEPVFYMPKSNVDFIRMCLEHLAADYASFSNKKRSAQVSLLASLCK